MNVARYIADLTGELARMARASELPTLAYLLEIARLEADQVESDASISGDAPRLNTSRVI